MLRGLLGDLLFTLSPPVKASDAGLLSGGRLASAVCPALLHKAIMCPCYAASSPGLPFLPHSSLLPRRAGGGSALPGCNTSRGLACKCQPGGSLTVGFIPAARMFLSPAPDWELSLHAMLCCLKLGRSDSGNCFLPALSILSFLTVVLKRVL